MRNALLLLGCVWLAAGFTISACRSEESRSGSAGASERRSSKTENAKDYLQSLQRRRVFFGHQSVGVNILDGLRNLSREQGAEVSILETPPDTFSSLPTIVHHRVGQNGDPRSKIRAFRLQIEKAKAAKYDVAILKLCYVDVTSKTDIEGVLKELQETLADLGTRYPETLFAPATVPLRTAEQGKKAYAKRLIGFESPNDQDNIRRNQFNRRLLELWREAPVFDVARAESTAPDGKREALTFNGQPVYFLLRQYSSDGGHLNEDGGKAVALEFLRTISEAIAAR